MSKAFRKEIWVTVNKVFCFPLWKISIKIVNVHQYKIVQKSNRFSLFSAIIVRNAFKNKTSFNRFYSCLFYLYWEIILPRSVATHPNGWKDISQTLRIDKWIALMPMHVRSLKPRAWHKSMENCTFPFYLQTLRPL